MQGASQGKGRPPGINPVKGDKTTPTQKHGYQQQHKTAARFYKIFCQTFIKQNKTAGTGLK